MVNYGGTVIYITSLVALFKAGQDCHTTARVVYDASDLDLHEAEP